MLFEYPEKKFTVRELAKRTKIPNSSVQRYLTKLKNKNFVTKENQCSLNTHLKFVKATFMINKMFSYGLIKHLEETLNPGVIIVFGSVRKGEYDHESDIDIFIETTKKIKVNLEKFEKKLNHKIQLFTKKRLTDLPQSLMNNVVNGIKVSGYTKIK